MRRLCLRTLDQRSANASPGRRPAYASTETSVASRKESRRRMASTVWGASGRTVRESWRGLRTALTVVGRGAVEHGEPHHRLQHEEVSSAR
jgi:hypothetical protein